MREMVKDVLLLAGAELGVGMPLAPAPSRAPSTAAAAAASRRTTSVSESLV